MSRFHLSFGLLTLAAANLVGVQSWPSWIQVPFKSFPVGKVDEAAGPEPPEALLLEQLEGLDTVREPEKAHALHTAMASMLRADGTQKNNQGTIQHLEAARVAALSSNNADIILSTRLALAEAYLEARRPQDAENELGSKPITNSLLSPDNFFEFSIKLDLARGRASFELGDTQLAAEMFEQTLWIASNPEDVAHLSSEMARAHACLGHSQKSLKPLRDALEVLVKAGKADMIPAPIHRDLALKLHTRLAEALHSMGDTAAAKARYEIVSSLQPKARSSISAAASEMQANIENLKNGHGPSLSCPGGARKQKFQAPSKANGGKAFKAKISALLEAKEYKKAEYELWNHLETQARPYKSPEAVNTLLTLGDLYQKAEKKSYYKAAQCFRKALPAALLCCGAQSKEAKTAFQGLSYLQDVIPAKVREESAVVLQEYLSALERSAPANDLGGPMQLV